MKSTISLFVFLLLASPASAYNPITAEPPEAYEIIPIENDPYVQREYLGDLEDFPDMYELTTDVAITLRVQVKQRSSKKAVPFGLIMVRQNEADGGVSEIARQNEVLEKWTKTKYSMLGFTLLEASVLEKEITPGTYRIEVSTPDNKGDYMLVVGEEAQSSGFFKALGQIYKTQRHFNYTPLHMLFSSYVYYPVGIMLVLYGIYRTWKYRKELYEYTT